MNPQTAHTVADPSTWRALSSDLLDGDVVWVPIRHHSPACARHVEALIERRRPWAVLIEGPRSFDEFIPFLLHPQAVFPLAIYANATIDIDGRSVHTGSYFPFCDYSPELVALRVADRVGARSRFIDADHQHLGPREDFDEDLAVTGRSFHHDEHYSFSEAMVVAAHRAGCRDHNDLWDQLFETNDRPTDEFFAAVNAFGLLARTTAHPVELEHDGTLAREAVMLAEIRKAIVERDASGDTSPIVVVTGAFHTQVLRDRIANGDEADPKVDPIPEVGEHGAHLIRYSYERLDALNGYSAGMPAPGWYHRLYELGSEPTPEQTSSLLLDVLGDVAASLRQSGSAGATSTPAMIGALHQARGLSALRGRARPGRTDILDATVSCFVQGDIDTEGLPVLAAARQTMTGDRLGSVPPGTARPPLADDFDAQCRRHRLPIDSAMPARVELDIYKRPAHRAKSCFLHRVVYLAIPYGVWMSGPSFGGGFGTHLVREIWNCQLSPATDVGLVEAGRFGATVEQAATARFIAETDSLSEGEPSAGRVAVHLARGAELGVYDALDRVVDELRQQAVLDPDLASVAAALSQLQLLANTRSLLDARRLESLPELITQLFARAVYLVSLLGDVSESEVGRISNSLLELRDATITSSELCEPELFWNEVTQLEGRSVPPMLTGTSLGLLWSANHRTDDEVVHLTRGYLEGGVDSRTIDGFLRGLLLAAKEIVWQVDGVTKAITEQLNAWDDNEFRTRLPGLRSAFSTLTPRETDRVAELVGASGAPAVTHLDENSLLANLERDSAVVEMLAADGVRDLGVT